jgi:hypothetical protein
VTNFEQQAKRRLADGGECHAEPSKEARSSHAVAGNRGRMTNAPKNSKLAPGGGDNANPAHQHNRAKHPRIPV